MTSTRAPIDHPCRHRASPPDSRRKSLLGHDVSGHVGPVGELRRSCRRRGLGGPWDRSAIRPQPCPGAGRSPGRRGAIPNTRGTARTRFRFGPERLGGLGRFTPAAALQAARKSPVHPHAGRVAAQRTHRAAGAAARADRVRRDRSRPSLWHCSSRTCRRGASLSPCPRMCASTAVRSVGRSNRKTPGRLATLTFKRKLRGAGRNRRRGSVLRRRRSPGQHRRRPRSCAGRCARALGSG